MKVSYRTANGRLAFEFESDNEKKLFADLAHIQEIFEDCKCGCCQSERVRFEVREFDKNKYYKLVCDQCGATLDYHQRKEGERLYLKDSDRISASRGWYRYKEGERAPEPMPAATHTQKPAPSGPTTPIPTRSTQASSRLTTPVQKQDETPMSAQKAHEKILMQLRVCDTLERCDGWIAWGKREFDFTPLQDDEQTAAYDKAMRRLGLLQSARK